MTQEDKQLLLADLCARLPYGVKLQKINEPEIAYRLYSIDTNSEELKFVTFEGSSLTICGSGYLERRRKLRFKPYLRPMSSMTEEEYKSISWEGCSHTYNYSSKSGFRFVEIKTFTLNILNWLNAHHFDYRGLIPKRLALEAPEGMYN